MFKILTSIFILINILAIILCTTLLLAAEPLEPGNHYFTADWCKYCQEQNVDIKLLQDQGYQIEIYNQEEVPEIFKDLNIKAIPMIIIVKIDEKGRQIIIRLKGKQPIRKLIEVLIKDDEDKE